MPDSGAEFKYLDEAAIEKLEMRASPYDWGYIDDAIPSQFKEEVLSDAPIIPHAAVTESKVILDCHTSNTGRTSAK